MGDHGRANRKRAGADDRTSPLRCAPLISVAPHDATTEVVVVGAGPAGAVAALLLARSSRQVTLVDRATFPRDKACGDLVGTDAIASLRRLEIDLPIVNATPPLAGAFVYAPTGRRLGATLRPQRAARLGARVIPRRDFDAALVAAAIDAGVTFRHATAIRVVRDRAATIVGVELNDQSVVRAAITIGADGWGSTVARAIDATPRGSSDVGIAVRTYLDRVEIENAMRFYVGERGDGYGWIFPLPTGGANVGLGFIRDEFGASAIGAAFHRFLTRPELRGAHETSPAKTWPIPFGWRSTAVSAAGALLVGDAASLASSLSGSGIHTAIASAAIAARVADRALVRGDVSAAALGEYDRRLRPIADRLRLERWLHYRVGTPATSARAIALANALPGSGQIAVEWLLNLG